MMARHVKSRIVSPWKRRGPLVWRLPGGDVYEALEGATFARGDKAIVRIGSMTADPRLGDGTAISWAGSCHLPNMRAPRTTWRSPVA